MVATGLRRRATTVHRSLADGTVVALDVTTGHAHHLDAAAARLWHLLDGTSTVDELVEAAASGAQGEGREDVERFVHDALAAGLVEPVP